MSRQIAVGSLCILVIVSLVQAEARPIRFKNGDVALTKKSPEQLRTDLSAYAARGERSRVLVQFDAPVTPADREKLEAAGIRLLAPLGENGYFASVSRDRFNAAVLSEVTSLTRAAEIQLGQKLHGDLLFDRVYDWMVVSVKRPESKEGEAAPEGITAADDPIVGVYVKFHEDVNPDQEAIPLLTTYKAMVRSRIDHVQTMVVELPYSRIKALANEDIVSWIEPPLPMFSELNAENRQTTGANIVQAAPYSLTGAGVKVMVYDGGRVRTTHQDFQGRAIVGAGEYPCTGVSDHSTHVAGTIGGAGVAVANNKGMAPGVDIVSYGYNQNTSCTLSQGFLYTDPGDMNLDYGEAINTYGAHISNNSIGTNTAPNGFPCSWEGDYGVTDTVIDSIVRGSLNNGVPFRIVWANGNERQVSTCGTTYHTTAPPACAKNHITVGALNALTDTVTSFTSWGPADDGRMKPDVSAPGCQSGGDGGVTSCSSSSDTAYGVKCGTSMASPTVCGLSALLMQDFRAQFPTRPDFRNSTLKILLAHTAVDLFNAGPDYQTGYGSVRIQPAVDFMRTDNFLEASVDQGGAYNVLVLVNPGDPQLKVTLAWDDPPGTPNVDPALINDLDLVVFDPSNNQRFPWTLGGLANPSAPAVQTQRNGVDNIEQVFVNVPAPGVYRVEVRGFNVPQGPQAFSLCASPTLVNCSSQGSVGLDRTKYACSSTVTITVNDCDLNTDDQVVETVNVTIASDTEPGGETVMLTETGAQTALFRGTITASTTDSAGVLHVSHGDTLTATYVDADDGMGGFNVVVTSNSTVDCQPPVISNVATSNIGARDATVTFTTDETAKGTVRWGTSCGSLTNTVTAAGFNTNHSLVINGLNPNNTYYYAVDAEDPAGNASSDDNGGACYSFSTPDIPELFTENFDGNDNDLDNKMIIFTPDASISKYKACTFDIVALPTDPTGGTTITTWTGTADDGNAQVSVTGGNTVKLYEQSFSNFFVGTNGYVTFGSGDSDYTETLADHFALRRVAAVFDDLNPGTGGSVSYKQLGDRIAVTWLNVPEFSTTNQNTFQIELYFDGRIVVSYLAVAAADGLAGLSAGTGLSPDYFESDLSNQTSGCGPLPPSAANSSVSVDTNTDVNITLVGNDPNGDPMVFTILSLPSNGRLTDPSGGTITSAPYTLLSAGNAVTYKSYCNYVGPDSFTFKVTAAGDDSNTATVSITVNPLYVVMFSDTFPTTSFDNTKWTSVVGASIDGVGMNEPSPPNSARFNGDPSGSDRIESAVMDLSAETNIRLTYWYQQRGGGESPDSADDLFAEYWNGATWVNLQTHLGSGPDMTVYDRVQLVLPAGAYHAGFRLRFRNTATTGLFDDWFVDDVSLDKPAPVVPCSCTILADVDLNGVIDGRDVVAFVKVYLNPGGSTQDEVCAADCQTDGFISRHDVPPFVNIVLSQP